MRTRYMGYIHYGISTERSEELQELAKLDENRELVQIAAEQSRSELAKYIVESLVEELVMTDFIANIGCRTLRTISTDISAEQSLFLICF